jgi:hypothetical protein
MFNDQQAALINQTNKDLSSKHSLISLSANEIAFSENKPSFYKLNDFPIECFSCLDEQIKKELVHKHYLNNVVITHPIVLNEKNNLFRTKIVIPFDNKFFFDHQYNHVPGMLIIEAGRQVGTAISHIYFNAPMDFFFILHNMESQFTNYISINTPVYIDVLITSLNTKNNIPKQISAQGIVHQNQSEVAKLFSSWTMVSPKVKKRFINN